MYALADTVDLNSARFDYVYELSPLSSMHISSQYSCGHVYRTDGASAPTVSPAFASRVQRGAWA